MIGQRVRIAAPGSGYDGVIGTVTNDYREPSNPEEWGAHLDAVLVEYEVRPGHLTDVVVGPEQVEPVSEEVS